MLAWAHFIFSSPVIRFAAREQENTVTTGDRSAPAAEPSSGDLSSPGETFMSNVIMSCHPELHKLSVELFYLSRQQDVNPVVIYVISMSGSPG